MSIARPFFVQLIMIGIVVFCIIDSNTSSLGQDANQVASRNEVATNAPTRVLNWLDERGKALKGLSLETINTSNALDPIGRSRVVLMGEEYHGVKEFTLAKIATFKWLVTEKHFSVFCIEDGVVQAERVNRYINGKPLEPAELVDDLYWCWKNPEMVEFIRWMREYNDAACDKQKITVHGYDVQSPHIALREVKDYLECVELEPPISIWKDLEPLLKSFWKYSSQRPDVQDRCRNALAELDKRLHDNRKNCIRRTSKADWRFANRCLNSAIQATQVFVEADRVSASEKRDGAMADNVIDLISQDCRKTFIWAHNAHISRSAYEGGFEPMGAHISRKFGDQCYTIGLLFNEGSYLLDPRTNQSTSEIAVVSSAPPESTNAAFARTGYPYLFIDLRNSPIDVATWLNELRTTRHSRRQLLKSFDAVLFVDRVHAHTLLEKSKRQQP